MKNNENTVFNPFTHCYYCQSPAIPNFTYNHVSVCESCLPEDVKSMNVYNLSEDQEDLDGLLE